MKKIVTILMVLSVGLIQAQKVSGDYDKSIDFTTYKTYSFIGWQDDSDKIMNDFDKERLREAIEAEMEAKGLKRLDSGGDMLVSLFIVIDKKTSLTAYSNYYGNMGYGYRRGGMGWGNGYSTTSYSENEYLKGTLVFDMFDSQSEELIWQGVATGTINSKPQKREKSIPKAIHKLMKKYPIESEKVGLKLRPYS